MRSYLDAEELSQLLLDLAEELDVPPSKYEEAADHYMSVGDWLNSEGSELAVYGPVIYSQGSFGLGTAVKPLGDGDYDVDAVCLLENPPIGLDQKRLKAMVGNRLKAHETYRRLLEPEGRRCWTLKYADASRFHLDVLPAIPHRGLDYQEAIHITDNQEPPTFWGDSNPKGYQLWFKDRMKVVFARQRELAALAKTANVEDIPEYEVRTPLQRLIQILKRHRDLHYGKDKDKPISIIITTLAARAYDNESDLYQALVKVIPGMKAHITYKNGAAQIPNPVIPSENFADKWLEQPRKQQVFFEWLARVETFGKILAEVGTPEELRTVLDEHFGTDVSNATLAKVASRKPLLAKGIELRQAQPSRASGILVPRFLNWLAPFTVGHREKPNWIEEDAKPLQLQAWVEGAGGRRPLRKGETVPKGQSLLFEVLAQPGSTETIYWQVVNTGREAESNGDLRGKMLATGSKAHRERTKYTGTHWVECFFVRSNGRLLPECTARSGEFVVKIE
ncbi:MAG: nucleotidyltransferase [Geothrix sp.]|nr:nucleotidyltransferase [Geothrix sp.]